MEFYRCEHCGNIVAFLNKSGVPVVCCGEKMKLLEPGVVEAAVEKHLPVVAVNGRSVTVSVGSVAHPMDENHYIEWIELLADNQSLTCFLKPGDKPEAVFKTDAEKVTAREYCNLHGHWKAEN